MLFPNTPPKESSVTVNTDKMCPSNIVIEVTSGSSKKAEKEAANMWTILMSGIGSDPLLTDEEMAKVIKASRLSCRSIVVSLFPKWKDDDCSKWDGLLIRNEDGRTATDRYTTIVVLHFWANNNIIVSLVLLAYDKEDQDGRPNIDYRILGSCFVRSQKRSSRSFTAGGFEASSKSSTFIYQDPSLAIKKLCSIIVTKGREVGYSIKKKKKRRKKGEL